MKIKVTAISDRVIEGTVSELDEASVEEYLKTGIPPKEHVLCTSVQGWPFRLNLGLCVTVEKATA